MFLMTLISFSRLMYVLLSQMFLMTAEISFCHVFNILNNNKLTLNLKQFFFKGLYSLYSIELPLSFGKKKAQKPFNMRKWKKFKFQQICIYYCGNFRHNFLLESLLCGEPHHSQFHHIPS